MSSLNKVMLIGRAGRDAESRVSKNGVAMSTFSLAVTEKYKENQTTEWFNVVAYNRQAEFLNRYLKKGTLVYIEGSVHAKKWVNQQGVNQTDIQVVCNEVRLLSGKNDSNLASEAPEGNDTSNKATGQFPSSNAKVAEIPVDTSPKPPVQDPPAAPYLADDDIPF